MVKFQTGQNISEHIQEAEEANRIRYLRQKVCLQLTCALFSFFPNGFLSLVKKQKDHSYGQLIQLSTIRSVQIISIQPCKYKHAYSVSL